MIWSTAQDVAEWADEGARKSYEEDHEVVPTMFFVGETGTLILHPGPSYSGEEHPTDIYADITWKISSLYPWRYIATVSECWLQRADATEDELAGGPLDREHDLMRGTLEKLHEQGDPSVMTSVVSFVLDVENRFESYVVTSSVEQEEPIVWRTDAIDVTDGHVEGAMGEALMAAYELSVPLPEDLPRPTLPMIAELICNVGIAGFAMVVNPI